MMDTVYYCGLPPSDSGRWIDDLGDIQDELKIPILVSIQRRG